MNDPLEQEKRQAIADELVLQKRGHVINGTFYGLVIRTEPTMLFESRDGIHRFLLRSGDGGLSMSRFYHKMYTTICGRIASRSMNEEFKHNQRLLKWWDTNSKQYLAAQIRVRRSRARKAALMVMLFTRDRRQPQFIVKDVARIIARLVYSSRAERIWSDAE
jgi:hypothetical protein